MDYAGLNAKLLANSAGTENSDPLMNRMEDKYLVSRSFLERLTARLRENLPDGESDTHVRFNYTNTIYLDTKDLDCFRDAAAGIKPRFKVRIRHYAPNGGKFENVAYLELKIKTEEGMTKKTRIRIPQDIVLGIANGTVGSLSGTDDLVNLNRDIPPQVLMNRIHTINSTLKKYGFRQQIVISYERRAYANTEIRVTVDDHIQYFDAANLGDAKELIESAPGFNKMTKLADRVRNTPYVILEVKHKGTVPPWLQDLMKDVKAERVKFSKYATAIVDFCKDGTNSGDISKQGLDVMPLIALFHDPVAKSKKSKDLANIAYVVLRDKNFVLVGKRKNNEKWGLPGGRFEGDEDREEVALRELKEETGIKLGKGDLTYEGKKIVETDDEIKTVYIFSGKHPGGEPKTKDGEFLSWEWMRCENGMLPEKILEEKMNGPTEAAFEKMGLTKAEPESDIHSLIDKLQKGGPGSGVKGHQTAKKEFGGAKNNPTQPYDEASNVERKNRNLGEEVGDDKNRKVKPYTTSGSSLQQTHEKNMEREQRKKTKQSTKVYSKEEIQAYEQSKMGKGHMEDSNILSLIDKLNKGGEGSGVKGHMTNKISELHPAVDAPPAKPVNKLHAHLQALEHGAVMPGITTQSGKPVVNDMETARAHGYDVQDHVDAMNAHFELAQKTQAILDKLKMSGHKIPQEGAKIAQFHERRMKEHMRARQFLEERKTHTAQAIKEKKKEAIASVKKATTQMGGGLGDRDLDISAYAQARDKAHQGWLEKLYGGMQFAEFGDDPKSFQTEKGMIHLSKVDDGLYSGYFTKQEDGMEDNVRMRIERITLPELVQLMSAKEWISPVFYEPKEETPEIEKFNEGAIPAAFSENAPQNMVSGSEAPMVDLAPKLSDSSNRADQAIKLLQLVDKLLN